MRLRIAALLAVGVVGVSCDPNPFVSPVGKLCSDTDPCPRGWECLQGACQAAGTCGAGTHKCPDNSCRTDDDPGFCGEACVACPDSKAGRPACVNGACASTCGGGPPCAAPQPVCLADAGACVGCEGDLDCPAAMPRCETTRHQCTPCRSDADCQALGLPQHCEVPTGRCLECLADAHCPLGRLCVQSTCQPGCNAAHGCPAFSGTTVDCGVDGLCHVTACPAGVADCDSSVFNGCEVDITTPANCGACARACGATNTSTITCAGGVCTSACASGFGNCSQPAAPLPDDGCETSIDTSASNCGGCGRLCAAANVSTPACTGGVCTPTCTSGFASCIQPPFPTPDDGCETATNASVVTDCGGCGRACNGNRVSTLSCALGLCNSSCVAGFGNCIQPTTPAADDGCETTFATSASNCGQCNRPCALANVAGAPTCAGSVCTSTCAAGFGNCTQPAAPAQDDGCETNTQTDVNNCGGCGVRCSTLNGTPSCVAGSCTWVCAAGWGHCATGNTGCETDLNTSAPNCGACGRACSGTNVVAASCAAGVCTSSCTTGYGNCLQPTAPVPDDGCETNTTTDATHCGSCARACAATNVSAATCSSSVCTSSCNAGFGNCLTPAAPAADDGCETDTTISAANCGGCGRACLSGGAVTAALCSGGVCASTCNAGFGNCVQPAWPLGDDGCETNTGTSLGNCGACGRACLTGGSVVAATCGNGVCTSACAANTGNCSQPVAPAPDDGCETNLTNDAAHCGSCARPCLTGGTVATPVCSGSVCTSTCTPGSGNCSQPAAPTADNGCETNTNTDPTHCGACPTVCTAPPNATPACDAGVCGVGGCNAGWGDCTGAPGCETNLNTNVDNCGACLRFCSASNVATRSCAAGLCTSSCVAGRGNCARPAAPTADDGCETNTTSDPLHCSACFSSCGLPPNAATAGCTASNCTVGSCQAGYMNCDGLTVSGCECAGSICCGANCVVPRAGGLTLPDGGPYMYESCTRSAWAACAQYYGVPCFDSVEPYPPSTACWPSGGTMWSSVCGPPVVGGWTYCWENSFAFPPPSYSVARVTWTSLTKGVRTACMGTWQ